MKKRKSHFGCIFSFVFILLAVFAACRMPSYIAGEQETVSVCWNLGRNAWLKNDFASAAKNWELNAAQRFFVRRPAKFLYWQAEALEKTGRKAEAASVRSVLLSKYPLDFYAFQIVPHCGGINKGNYRKLMKGQKKVFEMPYKNEVAAASARNGVESALIWAVMKRESKFDKNAVSSSGAVGLMQLMPDTAREIARKNGVADFNLYNARDNIMIGTLLLKKLLKRYNGDMLYALAAYNAGTANVAAWQEKSSRRDFWVEDIPYLETREFVRCVYENYSIYKLILAEK